MKLSRSEITKRLFTDWLRNDAHDLTFRRSDCQRCPVAIYLGSECDREVSVDHDGIMIDGEQYQMPQWLHDFIVDFDGLGGSRNVSARRALALLS